MSEDGSGNFPPMAENKDEPLKTDEAGGFGADFPASAIVSAPPGSSGIVSPTPFEARMAKIFLGPEGLRPIWRMVVYFLMFRALRFCLHALIYYAWPDTGILWLQLVVESGLVIVVLIPAVFMSRIEHRRFGDYGLPLRQALGKLFWFGVLWGFGSITVLLLALHGVHAFDFGGFVLHGARAAKFAVFWGAFFLIVGFYEEFFTRGYTQFTLTQSVGFWPAAVLLSAGFGVLHLENPGESWVGILGAVLIGFFFCLTLRRTGNLWFAIGFHAAWDWGESYFYSVPDSGGIAPGHLMRSSLHGPSWLTGGSVGPEGSALLFVMFILLWVIFDRIYREVKYPTLT
jgi:CAAX protease family protein